MMMEFKQQVENMEQQEEQEKQAKMLDLCFKVNKGVAVIDEDEHGKKTSVRNFLQ